MQNTSTLESNFKGIIDSTLREGAQFRWGEWSLDQQIHIVNLLAAINVDRVELGNPINHTIRQEIIDLLAINNRPKMLVHVRNRLADLQAVLDLPHVPEGINILCCADIDRLTSMRLSMRQHLNDLKACIQMGQSAGLEIRVGVEDYFSEHQAAALEIYQLADQLGVDRVSVPDTKGGVAFWQVTHEISHLRQQIKADIEVHFHNDLGQALTNSLAALQAGANWIDTTILGIGERSGITSLSLLLSNLYNYHTQIIQDHNYNLSLLTEADNWLADSIGVSVPFNKITNQQTGFAHGAGIHIQAIVNHGAHKYELFPPGIIGNQRHLLTGSKVAGRTTQEQVNQFYLQSGRT